MINLSKNMNIFSMNMIFFLNKYEQFFNEYEQFYNEYEQFYDEYECTSDIKSSYITFFSVIWKIILQAHV